MVTHAAIQKTANNPSKDSPDAYMAVWAADGKQKRLAFLENAGGLHVRPTLRQLWVARQYVDIVFL